VKKLLVVYSHFAPAYKAGGPVQSLVNLVVTLRSDYKLYVFCSAYEMGERTILSGIMPDAWNTHNDGTTQVFYSSKPSYKVLETIFDTCLPDVVYLNGLFLPTYTVMPIVLARRKNIKTVLAPRGMLQAGALSLKPLKKKVFLACFKFFGLHQSLCWHATDRQEEADIKRIFGGEARVTVAPNIPKAPYLFLPERKKKANELKMVYLSLIAEKKNLHLALLAIREIKSTPIIFDIYGPIKDREYWEKCKPLMESQVHQIHYKGAINPTAVQETLSEYDVFILPTKGENFGHAIYEALSVGTPCIISRFTPWGMLQEKSAGITIDLTIASIKEAMDRCLLWSNLDLERESAGAHALAVNYFNGHDSIAGYKAVFK